MPTEKRARQKAARRKKRAAELRRARMRRQLRTGGLVAAGAAVVIVLVLLTTGTFSSHTPPAGKKGDTKPTATTTTSAAALKSRDKTLQAAADKAAVAAGCPTTPKARTNTLHWSSPPPMTIDTSGTYTATVKTTAGSFAISLDAKTAPNTVNNFVFLADQGFYKCNVFHRVIPGFMDQTGDPTGTGSGGPGYSFANENVPAAYATGDVAMANSGGTDSDGSQFFVLAPGGATTLNADLKRGDRYSLLGTVTSGMPIVEKINSEGNSTPGATGVPPNVVQRILDVTIHES
ncbi:MAG: peptidylprolyl isomerase [Acidimicrobiales bacterium]